MPNPTVVIYGPQGCGKSMYAQRLARHFGLSAVLDDEYELTPGWAAPLPESTLILAIDRPPAHVCGAARVLSFQSALILAGFDRSPTTIK